MRLTIAASILSVLIAPSHSFKYTSAPSLSPSTLLKYPSQHTAYRTAYTSLHVSATPVEEKDAPATESVTIPPPISQHHLQSKEDVDKLSFRDLQKECKSRELPANGSTAVLRKRLQEAVGLEFQNPSVNISEELESALNGDEEGEEVEEKVAEAKVSREFQTLCNEVHQRAAAGHWKTATRRLKKLKKLSFNEYTAAAETDDAAVPSTIPEDVYLAVLRSCLADRSSGARASQPARKVLEEMVEAGYVVPADLGRSAVINCLGNGPGGTHDECGGIDVALAMISALERQTGRNEEDDGMLTQVIASYEAVVIALGKDGDVEECVEMLGMMVIDKGMTPLLGTFAQVAQSVSKCNKDGTKGELVLQVLSYAKMAGYELDSIAHAEAGRTLLACGVIVAEGMDNLALGLRLLTAARKSEDPSSTDKCDTLVCSSSSAAQRASTLIHKRSIDRAIADDNWKLAVKILELMAPRSLTPSPGLLKKVIAVCAKSEKSRKATAILLDWVSLFDKGETADRPPLSVFNTVVNACEICGEEELTLQVLDTMKKTHEVDGNTITFNIALKRLAKLKNKMGCEGIIIGMLQAGIEPTVVSYTTAIGACAQDKDFVMSTQWLERMRSRCVSPNVFTYNTALASCLDGTLEGSKAGSEIAVQMMEEVGKELVRKVKGNARYNSALPNVYTKTLSRLLMKQLRDNWRNDLIDMDEAKTTVRVPLLRLIDFEKTEEAKKLKADRADIDGDDECVVIEEMEVAVEYLDVEKLHKDSHRTAEI
eukprot:CAMPEP_0194370226 /NCGR_PEP_ID=MMETSP0174-20130528/18496_1 /TAXON_ID=216777 /ORGANISM="Proboscia alata, Strain PI-D3" /LENGTH=767 /DNA_ID=CAMNT_0039147535 /DNA_START=166 /DNA_END=2469 /DNA_ORIENTATION=+